MADLVGIFGSQAWCTRERGAGGDPSPMPLREVTQELQRLHRLVSYVKLYLTSYIH